MRLDKIKLAGFKSFVDPTTVSFSSNLTGIVGPNGCGKSNVIDAVRWVMGESSAKHLRGESMADVIFNGSSTRKPIGQASIELLFDNSDGSCPGQYANFNEISVKRSVSRDGTSNYYLNGTRCRRRDIMDLFLGTGMGPRSYSIIEQGMISRFIEARPDDMRVFIEEAAGISKYKERRRETENRIKHTRENLERINDLREELEKQISHLQRQANTAEKYKLLKEEERVARAQLLALRRRGIDEQADKQKRAIAEKETAYEAAVAELRGVESKLEHLREQHTEAHDNFNHVQGHYYKLGADVARIEQAIQHSKEKRQQLQQDSREVENALNEARRTLETDNRKISELDTAYAEIEPAMQAAREAEQTSREALARAEEAMHDWQLSWEEFNSHAAEPGKTVQVEQTRIQHLEGHQQQINDRVGRYRQELQGLETQALEDEINSIRTQLGEVDSEVNGLAGQLQSTQQQISQSREHNENIVETLNASRSDLQSQQGRLSSLEALQEDALGKGESVVSDWLDQNGLKDAQRLAETIDVEQRWQTAVETVLGFHLQAVSVDDAGNLGQALAGLDKGAIGIIERGAVKHAAVRDFATPLVRHVRSEWSLDSLLAGIYTADSIEQALSLRGQLQAHESIVTAEGVWLGPNWMRMTRNTDEQAGVLQREAEIRETEKRIAELTAHVDDLQQQLDAGRDALHGHERARDEIQASLDTANRQHAEYKSKLGSRETTLEQMRSRSQQIESQLGELRAELEQDSSALQEARARLQEAEATATKLDVERAELQLRRDNLRETLDQAREQARADRDTAHQHALRAESNRTELSSTRQAMQRIESQISTLEQRHAELQQFVTDSEAPLKNMEEELAQALSSRQEAEEQLNAARKQVQDIEHAMREAGDDNGKADQQVQDVRGELEQLRMDFQGISVRLQTLQEQIDETGFELAALYAGLPEDATEQQWQEDVSKLESRIQRLGAINLAAIDEFKERSERKEYLDRQMTDLEDALNTLENAISKIDRETRTRFKETFDTVNNGFKAMFPRLFGGGHAYMELTDDDLLSTGITVMARPPGKRNGTIHLLSGGEKALTAVALVFAIFELNPAPFCMLDEVDAPLDDANVARFCELVQSMSDRIQFIFITHNKVTMELAGQLMGVTMSEPGVSRLVAVDVDEAASLAAM
ncbi:chromosome segregation protein SMC [Sulfuriflexus sp.]|uniref:chromosome segregation protein SMC n=1 Tax=Sulfuriflexus sp. TaxID=2015443 RepID=UPI0028CDB6C0|nr:chromosome segregation protein SMC [Sulfuriflexus sp.]MDT8403019.1 chromosome segregation protein SMC [Sulfuriflexus sp.]